MSSTSLILDFETLSTDPDATVIEIGCLAVNRSDFTAFGGVEFRPTFLPQIASGRSFTADTIEWQRSKDTFPQTDGTMSLVECTRRLAEFIEYHNPHRIWAWGKDFERPLLENICRAAGISLPAYQFRSFACARDIWQHAFGIEHRPEERPHRALADCKSELRDIHAALRHLNLTHVF